MFEQLGGKSIMERGHLLKVARLLTLTLRFALYNKMDELSKLLFWDRENKVSEIIKKSVNGRWSQSQDQRKRG